MANGDHVKNYSVRDGYESVDDSPYNLCSIDLGSVAGQNIFVVTGYVCAQNQDGNAQAWQIFAYGTIDDGSVNVSNVDISIAFGSEGYLLSITTSGTSVVCQITGANGNTVTWAGRLNIDITESVLVGA